jgi:hypothetical protein
MRNEFQSYCAYGTDSTLLVFIFLFLLVQIQNYLATGPITSIIGVAVGFGADVGFCVGVGVVVGVCVAVAVAKTVTVGLIPSL